MLDWCFLQRREAADFGRVAESLCIFCVSWERVGELEVVSFPEVQLDFKAVNLCCWRGVWSDTMTPT